MRCFPIRHIIIYYNSIEIRFSDFILFISVSAETKGTFNQRAVAAIIASGNLILMLCFNSITFSFTKELMSYIVQSFRNDLIIFFSECVIFGLLNNSSSVINETNMFSHQANLPYCYLH